MSDLLIVDVGNTNIKWAVAASGVLQDIERSSTKQIDAVAQEIAASGLPVALSCVRPGAADAIKAALRQRNEEPIVEINAEIENPVTGFYSGFGADRIADAAAAYVMSDKTAPIAVVGLGTGTAITAISPEGRFLGGYTTLGLGAICQSLTDKIPALPQIDPAKGLDAQPGSDVYTSLCRGTVFGHIGLIEKWINLIKDEFGDDTTVTVTGGWSELIGPLIQGVNSVEPELTLKGILLIAQSTQS